ETYGGLSYSCAVGLNLVLREIYLFAVAAALMAGFGAWAASTTQTRVAAPTGVRIDPSQMMMNAKDLPTQRVVDFSVISTERSQATSTWHPTYCAAPSSDSIHIKDGKIDSEHIFWDQASVLVQLGL